MTSIKTIDSELAALYAHQLRVERQCTTLMRVRCLLNASDPAWEINTQKILNAKANSLRLSDYIKCLHMERAELRVQQLQRRQRVAKWVTRIGVVLIAMFYVLSHIQG